MRSSHGVPEILLNESRAAILRRAFEIIAVAALAFGLCGGTLGLLVGVFAPGIARGLYAPGRRPSASLMEPRSGWSQDRRGTGIGLRRRIRIGTRDRRPVLSMAPPGTPEVPDGGGRPLRDGTLDLNKKFEVTPGRDPRASRIRFPYNGVSP